ncbi:MAG: sensor histidine kinase [Candidatus Rifleibacteriota bacterium]
MRKLKERVKELSALHKASRLFQKSRGKLKTTLSRLVKMLPAAWQYPSITSARISFGTFSCQTADFIPTPWVQKAEFTTKNGKIGAIEVAYLEEKPQEKEGPFLLEERALINSLAQMLQSHIDQRNYRSLLRRNNASLESLVAERTKQLTDLNQRLMKEVGKRNRVQLRLKAFRNKLRKLLAETTRREEKHRRVIAANLHDTVGQALAVMKMKLLSLHGEAIFYGLEQEIDEIRKLLEKTIVTTRSLTSEISSPIIYELELSSSLPWLIDKFSEKNQIPVSFSSTGKLSGISEQIRLTLFRGCRELLNNVVKHASATKISVAFFRDREKLFLIVEDDGKGFSVSDWKKKVLHENSFGLFNVREQILELGGAMDIESTIGKGTRIIVTLPFMDFIEKTA